MGKGQIISGGTDGKYNVKLLLHKEHIEDKIKDLESRIAALEIQIDGMEEGPAKTALIFKMNALIKQKEYLENNMPEDETIEAWCADLTEDLSGDVGTIEVPGERGSINIRPGYDGNAEYNEDRDGQLQPSVASKSAAAVFYNLAMLPGWQKWMPTHRYGRIISINSEANTAKVELDDIPSSQQDLNINYQKILDNVPFEYMTCDNAAFEEDDHIIIEFTSVNTQSYENWATAKIIGFVDNPKACEIIFYFELTRGDETEIDNESGLLTEIKTYNSDEEEVPNITTWDSEESKWKVVIAGEYFDSDGYFVDYNCTDGIETQYPYRYKAADKRDPDDLITEEGSYSDTIPYWKIVVQGGGAINDIGDFKFYRVIVYSSVTFRLTHRAKAPANYVTHVLYPFAPTVESLTGGGERCCTAGSNTVADVNGPDPAVRAPGAEQWANGGWGNSGVKIDITSTLITYTEDYQRTTELDLAESEIVGADVDGVTREIRMTNNTPIEYDVREFTCSAECAEGTRYLSYFDLRTGLNAVGYGISIQPEYDY